MPFLVLMGFPRFLLGNGPARRTYRSAFDQYTYMVFSRQLSTSQQEAYFSHYYSVLSLSIYIHAYYHMPFEQRPDRARTMKLLGCRQACRRSSYDFICFSDVDDSAGGSQGHSRMHLLRYFR